MNTLWGSKATHRRKRAIRRTKVRWDILGLQNPVQLAAAPSIEDIRRQIISAASQGLSQDTLSRSHAKAGRLKSGSKASMVIRERGGASK